LGQKVYKKSHKELFAKYLTG